LSQFAWHASQYTEKTIAENCLKWGTGGINIDESRVEGKPRTTHADGSYRLPSTKEAPIKGYDEFKQTIPTGRFSSQPNPSTTAKK